MDPIEAVNKSMQAVKILMTAEKTLEVANLKMQLAEVYTNLADVRTELISLKEENSNLKNTLAGNDTESKLKTAFKIEARLEAGYLVLSEIVEGHQPGKYCNACFLKEKRVINLVADKFSLKCSSCGTTFKNPDYKAPAPQFITKTQNPFRRF